MDKRRGGRAFIFENNEKFKVGWNCVKNLFFEFGLVSKRIVALHKATAELKEMDGNK